MNKLIVFALAVIVIVIVGPLLTIWSLNTLFPNLYIEYGFREWFAVVLLGSFIKVNK